MYLSTSHPGINTSPQSQLQKEERTKYNTFSNAEDIPYDGDESDMHLDLEDYENEDKIISSSELYHPRMQASSLPDLLGCSLSTSTYSLQHDIEASPEPIAINIPTNTNTTIRRKKRRKRRSESEVESPSKTWGSPLTITKSSYGATFVASSTPLKGQPQLVEIPPLRAHFDLGNSIGRRRGVCGCGAFLSTTSNTQQTSPNSPTISSSDTSYLDITLFTLFYFSDQFDEWVLDEKAATGYPSPASKEVRALLRKEILFSLRTSYFCPSVSVGRLFKSLFPVSQPYTMEFSRFLRFLLEKVLTLSETTHYTNGASKLIHILKDKTPTPTYLGSSLGGLINIPGHSESTKSKSTDTTVQQMFERSLGDLKLLSMPQPGLFLCVDNPLVVPHNIILPNIQLDLSRTLIQLSDDNETESDLNDNKQSNDKMTESRAKDDKGQSGYFSEETQFCKWFRSLCKIVYEYLQNLVEQFPTYSADDSFNQSLISESINNSWSISVEGKRSHTLSTNFIDDDEEHLLGEELPIEKTNRKKKNKGKLIIALDLMAVICLEHSSCYQNQYSAFVRCGQNPRRGWAPWVHFTPCDQGAPLVRRVDDLGKWLSRLEKKPENVKSLWRIIPSDIQTMLTSSAFFIYTPKADHESQNTLFSYVNEC